MSDGGAVDGNYGPEPRADAAVWVVRAGSRGVDADLFLEQGLVAIGSEEVDLSDAVSRNAVSQRLLAYDETASSNGIGNLHRFRNEIRVGDVALVPVQSTRELVWGVFVGDYRYAPDGVAGADHQDGFAYHHIREVLWARDSRSRDELPKGILYSLGSLLTVFLPKGQIELLRYLQTGEAPVSVPDPEVPSSEVIAEDELVEAIDDAAELSLAEQRSRNEELIQQHISRLDPYDVQDLVAGILAALGYETQVSPPGPDGGIDITAARDPLFIEPPVIKVQVKARQGAAGRPDLQQLNGAMDEGDYGIFVSTGGFSSHAKAEARAFPRIQIWDMERLVKLLLAHYEEMSTQARNLVPLAQVWVLDEGT